MQRREMLLKTGVAALGLWSSSVGRLFAKEAKENDKKAKILYYARSAGWVHPVADRQGKPLAFSEAVFTELGRKHNLEVQCSQDPAVFDGNLDEFDLLSFYTGGMPFSDAQMRRIIDAVSAGKPCVGIHSASDNFAGEAIRPFLEMLGGSFVVHGQQQKARQKVVSPKFPGMQGLGDGFEMEEEWYVLDHFAKDIHVVLLQETDGMKGDMYQRPPFPSTWARMHGKGRVFYTSLGHREDVWTSPVFQQILPGGISWALGRLEADMTPNYAEVTAG